MSMHKNNVISDDITINNITLWRKIQNVRTGPVGLVVERALGGMEGCGFDPQPRHTKSRKKIVPVAPLLTLGIER